MDPQGCNLSVAITQYVSVIVYESNASEQTNMALRFVSGLLLLLILLIGLLVGLLLVGLFGLLVRGVVNEVTSTE